MVTVVVLLVTVVYVRAEDVVELTWSDLPYANTFAGPVDVRIHITGIPAPVVLQVNMTKPTAYIAGLSVDGVFYGDIESPITIFSVPVSTTETNLTFLARDLTVQISPVGRGAVILNSLDHVIFAGYTYPEEFQKPVGGQWTLFRASLAMREFGSVAMSNRVYSLNVTSPSGEDIEIMSVGLSGISRYSYLGIAAYSNTSEPGETQYFKIRSTNSARYRALMWTGDLPAQAMSRDPNLVLFPPDPPGTVVEGDTVDVDASLSNTGNDTAEGVWVDLYVDGFNASSRVDTHFINIVNPSETWNFTLQWNTTGWYGCHEVHVIVDPKNYIEEKSEDNHQQSTVCVDSPVLYQDSDGDGLPNQWEIDRGLNPNSNVGSDGAAGDPDADTRTNLQEYQAWSYPRVADTDADGLKDGGNEILRLRLLAIQPFFVPPSSSFYLKVATYRTSSQKPVPYAGYRVPETGYVDYNGFSPQNLSSGWVVHGVPFDIYNAQLPDSLGRFSVTVDGSALTPGFEYPLYYQNAQVAVTLGATRMLNQFIDPSALLRDGDWDRMSDAFEILRESSRVVDFRGHDADNDGLADLADKDSDNDVAMDSLDLRTDYYPAWCDLVYDFPIYEIDMEGPCPGSTYRYPEFVIDGGSPMLDYLTIVDEFNGDTDGDGLVPAVGESYMASAESLGKGRTGMVTPVLFVDSVPRDEFKRGFVGVLVLWLIAMSFSWWAGSRQWARNDIVNSILLILGIVGVVFGLCALAALLLMRPVPLTVWADGISLPGVHFGLRGRRGFIPKDRISSVDVDEHAGFHRVTLVTRDGRNIWAYCRDAGIVQALDGYLA